MLGESNLVHFPMHRSPHIYSLHILCILEGESKIPPLYDALHRPPRLADAVQIQGITT